MERNINTLAINRAVIDRNSRQKLANAITLRVIENKFEDNPELLVKRFLNMGVIVDPGTIESWIDRYKKV